MRKNTDQKLLHIWTLFTQWICIGFTQKEKKNVKVIDLDISNRKLVFKVKSEILKRNANHKKLTKNMESFEM